MEHGKECDTQLSIMGKQTHYVSANSAVSYSLKNPDKIVKMGDRLIAVPEGTEPYTVSGGFSSEAKNSFICGEPGAHYCGDFDVVESGYSRSNGMWSGDFTSATAGATETWDIWCSSTAHRIARAERSVV